MTAGGGAKDATLLDVRRSSPSSPCRRRPIANPRAHRERLTSARALRRRARDAADRLDMRLLARATPLPEHVVESVQLLHRSATDWLIVVGRLSPWSTPADTGEQP